MVRWLIILLFVALAGMPQHSVAADDAHGAAHAEPGHGKMGEPEVLDTSRTDLAIYTVFVFGALLLVLWKFAWNPILEGLDKREALVNDRINRAEQLHEEAKQMMAEYEERLNKSQDEVRAIIEEARKDAETTKQGIISEAEAEVNTLRERMHRELETAKSQALKEITETGADLAVQLASRIVREELSREGHAKLIDEALEGFRSAATPSSN